MSANMAKQGGRIQLEQSNKHLALNMAKIGNRGFSRTGTEELQHLINRLQVDVREERKRGVEFPGHRYVKATIEWHPAMVHENQMDGCLPCQNGTPKNAQTCCRPKGAGAPPPDRLRQVTSEPTPPPPRMPPAPSGDIVAAHGSQIKGVPSGYAYIHTPLPSTQIFNLDAYVKDYKRNNDFIPDLLTDERISTG